MGHEYFFTEAVRNMTAEEKEAFNRSVILSMDHPAAKQLRNDYYQTKLRHMGENVRIGANVKLVNPENISIGDNVLIEDHCTLIASSVRGITLQSNVMIKQHTYLDTESSKTGYIELGTGVYIGVGCCLYGHMGLEIGEHSLLAQNITITPYSHQFADKETLIKQQGGHMRTVTIGRDCYIGMSCSILYSADIGDGCVIGSGSVVVKPIPDYSVAVGVPARVIKKRG